jgi:prepilin-type processing-associated H-X9-DG protein
MTFRNIQTPGSGLKDRDGFSIIELLVIIAVLAVLAALLLPSFTRLRSASRQIVCSIQLKRVDDGLSKHAEDFDNRYAIAGGFVAWEQIDPMTRKPSWMQQLTPYVSGTDVFSGCADYPVSSQFHYFLGARAAYIEADEQFAAVELEKVKFPSAFVVSGDNNFNDFDESGSIDDADKDDYTFMTQVFSQDDTHWFPQHDGMLNTAFADGHVAIFDKADYERMTYRYDTMSAY